jgi:predicted dienelactone hydrolase
MNPEMIDQPLDILFALNQMASNPPAGLAGMIDADHAGAIGYSFDGYNFPASSSAFTSHDATPMPARCSRARWIVCANGRKVSDKPDY